MAGKAYETPIRVRRLEKSFKNLPVLRGVDLDVASGECVALLGRNGAGKSTLIRVLSGTVTADAGDVLVAGYDVDRHRRAAQAQVGHVLGDERAWFWRLTGRQNLEFFAALYTLDRAQARHRADDVIESAGLSGVADRAFGTYSSGMRLRFGIARALLHEPSILLLDEPSRTLDIPATRHLWEQLEELTGAGTAALVATHDVHEAVSIAGRCVLLHDGTMHELGRQASAAELERAVLDIAGTDYLL